VTSRAERYDQAMPFTAAHVLAVLPAVHARRALRLDPTCLVIGSMVPDFEYFARGELVGQFGHTLAGVVGWAIPVTLILAVVFHGVVKWPLLLAGPRALTGVLASPWRERWTAGAVASVIGSAVLGDLTHVVWDAATHSDGFIVQHVPALARAYALPRFGDVVLHRILQHASTLVGLAGVAAYLDWRIRRAPPVAVAVRRAGARVAFAGCIVAGVTAAVFRLHLLRIIEPGNVIAAAISGTLAGAIVASLIMRRAALRYRRLVLENVEL
jgi:hypothetical protein